MIKSLFAGYRVGLSQCLQVIEVILIVQISHSMRLDSATGKGSYLDIGFLSLIRILYNNVQVKHHTLTFVFHSHIRIPGILKTKQIWRVNL